MRYSILSSTRLDMTIHYYLDDFVEDNQIDTLVLGCTHYPLIRENLRRIYPGLRIVSSSKEAATAVQIELEKHDLLADRRNADNVFYASDLSENFVNMIQRILGKDQDELNIRFKNLDL